MSIRAKLVSSSAWMALAAIFNNLSATLVFILLARLLTPEQFGIVAFASIFMDIARVVATGGVTDVLVERETWDERTASSAFWCNLALSLALMLLIGGVAAPLSYAYYDREFGLVLGALSLLPLIEGFTTVPTASLKHAFRYKAIAARSALFNLFAGAIGIALAWFGYGVWALVISKLVGGALSSLILWHAAGWRPRLMFSSHEAASLVRPSVNLLGSQLAAQLNLQAVGMVIGAFLGPAALAQYRVGTRVLSLLASLLITPIQSSAISAFSRLEERSSSIGPAYLRLTRACSVVAAPVYIGLAAIGPDLVGLLFGPAWSEAGYIVSLNALMVGAAVIMYFFGPAMTAIGRSQALFATWIAALASNLLIAAVLLPYGLVAVVAGLALRPYLTLPLALRLLHRNLGLSPLRILRGLAPALVAATAMAALLVLIRLEWLEALGPLPRMIAMAALGLPLYLGLLLLIDKRLVAEMRDEITPLLARLIRPRKTHLR